MHIIETRCSPEACWLVGHAVNPKLIGYGQPPTNIIQHTSTKHQTIVANQKPIGSCSHAIRKSVFLVDPILYYICKYTYMYIHILYIYGSGIHAYMFENMEGMGECSDLDLIPVTNPGSYSPHHESMPACRMSKV